MNCKKFPRDFCIHYCNINKYKETTTASLLNFLEETAISHSESAGYGIDNLKREKIAWVLIRWSLEVERYPLWNEVISVETWPSGLERFYATREFLIKDSRGNIIVKASSLWILLDTEKRRPKRIPPEFGQAYGLSTFKALDNPFSEFGSLEGAELSKKFYVRRSDIDTNNHVNNISYVGWMLEAVPDEIYEDFFIKSLEIVYKKETVYGSMINSLCNVSKNNGSEIHFLHSIKDDGGIVGLADGKTFWQKRIQQS